LQLTLNLTHACNMGCSYCNAGAKSSRSMHFETGREGIRLALDEARGDDLEVAFFGGEPLLEFERLIELADEALQQAGSRGVGCRFSVTTNGTLLDAARADALAARGFHLGLSVDGAQAAQDATRTFAGGRSTAAAVERALDVALARFQKLTAIAVIDPRNVVHLEQSVAHLVERGVPRITLNPSWLSGWTDADRETWASAYEAIARLWADRHRQGQPFVLSTIDPKIWRRLTEQTDCGGCGFGRSELAVAPSGRLYPCGRIVGEDPDDARDPRRLHCLGDVRQGLDRQAQACLPRVHDTPPECQACAYRSRCASHCGCSNAEATGDPAQPSGLLCWHETLSIGLADQAASALYAERDPSFMARFYLEPARPTLASAP
jgi:uncharacterized protein